MYNFKVDDSEKFQCLDHLRELADSLMCTIYPEDMNQNEVLQSVPDQDAHMTFLDQHRNQFPNNGASPIGASPMWIISSQNFTNLNAAATGENLNPYLEELSPAPSSTGLVTFTGYESFGPVEKQPVEQFSTIITRIGVSEEELQEFGVKELNSFLKSNGLSKDEQQCVKNRRRTLKNRGYAHNCRIKKIKANKSMESENVSLQRELDHVRGSVNKAKKERDAYEAKLEELVAFFKLQKKIN